MMMKCLSQTCRCGATIEKFEVGLTPDHCLCLAWQCPACQQKAWSVIPLTDCDQNCPEEEIVGTETPCAETQEGDNEFLRSIGVRVD